MLNAIRAWCSVACMVAVTLSGTGIARASSGAEPETSADVSVHQAPLPTAEEIAQLPPDGGSEFNRLIFETSPYLRQHARNPVDWYPWGDEAFAKAKAENKPVFLSVGYSSCHWCHVMAHESFEDPETAQLMNELFVNIKVDREERPDVDDIYMKAVQLVAGRGGWPMSVFLLPDGRPYWGGTYFPREDRGNYRGFKTILRYMAQAYHEQRDEVNEQASRIVEGVAQQAGGVKLEPQGPPSRALMQAVVEMLRGGFDKRHGGFSGAPKFPPHMSLDALLYEYERTQDKTLEPLIRVTLDRMMRGGVYDQVGGGFHRYSTDGVWLLPHFEKMLYDNGQLARSYAAAYRVFGDDRYRETLEGICDWVLREMTAPEGGFYSAYDADSEGEEGKFYVWSYAEVMDVLGEEDGGLFCRVYGIERDGNFHDEATRRSTGLNIPHLETPMRDIARELEMDENVLRDRMAAARLKLREVRDKRVWPGLDDKVLTSWNGLMIAGLAEAGQVLNEPKYTDAAARSARFVLDTLQRDGRLLRSYNHGQAKLNGYLDDYAFLAFGLLALYDATNDDAWLNESKTLADTMIEHYWDEQDGGFYFTSDDHEELVLRSKEMFDGAIPSGNGMAARVLVHLAATTGEPRYADAARAAIDAGLGWMQRAPRATESLILAVSEAFDAGLIGGPQTYVPEPEATDGVPVEIEESDARWEQDVVTADAYASHTVLQPGMNVRLAVRLDIADGWHVNSHEPKQDYLIPTALTITAEPHMTSGSAMYPPGKDATFAFSQEALSVYEGVTWLEASVLVNGDAKAGPGTIEIGLVVQPCNDKECLAPMEATLKIPVTIVATRREPESRHTAIFNKL